MKTKQFITICVILGLSLMISSNALGYITGASYSWNAGTPNYNASASLHTDTINTSLLIMGDFLGQNSSTPNTVFYGDSGVGVGWDDIGIAPVGNANTNGDDLDGLWILIRSGGGWWDLGGAYNTVAVMTSQTQGPYLDSGLQYRVYGTNTLWDDTTLSAQAPIIDVFLDGRRTHNSAEDGNQNLWLSDDITGIFQLDASYRYIKLIAWDTSGALSEPLVDAVAAVVPVPGAVLLGSIGVGFVGWLRIRRML